MKVFHALGRRFRLPPLQSRLLSSAAEIRSSRDNTKVTSNVAGIEIQWSDGHRSTFDSAFLRQTCFCDACMHPTGQRLVSFSSIPVDPIITQLAVRNDQVHISWSDQQHESAFELTWLREHCYSNMQQHAAPQTKVVSQIQYEDFQASQDAVFQAMDYIVRDGLCMMKNVPSETTQLEKIATSFSPISHSYLYGPIWDVKSQVNPVNIAYTNNQLPYHMDLAYYESPPGIQFLHCLQFDAGVQGGHSLFVDALHAAEILKEQDVDSFNILTRVPATFQKHHTDRQTPAHLTYQRPHIQINGQQQVIAVYWSPPFEGPLQVPSEDIRPYATAYRSFEKILASISPIDFRMEPGDIVMFNQRRMLHSRTGFYASDGGVRHFRGTYCNVDEFSNAYTTLAHRLKKRARRLRLGNGNFF